MRENADSETPLCLRLRRNHSSFGDDCGMGFAACSTFVGGDGRSGLFERGHFYAVPTEVGRLAVGTAPVFRRLFSKIIQAVIAHNRHTLFVATTVLDVLQMWL